LDGNLNEHRKNFELDEGGSLSGWKELLDIFPGGVEKGRVHIVVKSPGEFVLLSAFVTLSNLKSVDSVLPPLIDLNCWVTGEPPERVFSVKIEATEKVLALKEAIKEKKKPAYDHIPPDTLDIWNVSVSDVHTLIEQPSNVNFADDPPLPAMERLSNIFSGVPEEGHLHIVVKSPIIGKCVMSFTSLLEN
jgi:hypothetical protein